MIPAGTLFQVPAPLGKQRPSTADLRPVKTRPAQKNEAQRCLPAGLRSNGWRAVLLRLIFQGDQTWTI